MVEIIVIIVVVTIVLLSFYNKKIDKKINYVPVEELNVKDKEFIDLINQHRNSLGLSTLKVSSLLCELAEEKVQYMIENNAISHDRVTEFGERSKAVLFAEIVAKNYRKPLSLLNGYLGSTRHKAILEKPSHTWIGSATFDNYNCVFFATY